ncbi:unnamed protein product [Brachionus calyciflorus]|uniref:Transmembrane protein n=1 Tax=Brachionus calyciflorus TaxID=104777 RepID=A0A814LE70_9BILA|nr:unnamed protein product [Brachionus calyciflorus]
MNESLQKSLIEDFIYNATFYPTPTPRRKIINNKFKSNNSDYSKSNEKYGKIADSIQNKLNNPFDLIVSIDSNNSEVKYNISTMPLPRKPRKNLFTNSKKSTLVNSKFNDIKKESLCLCSSSYASNTNLITNPTASNQFLFKEIQENFSDKSNYSNIFGVIETPKLQRPSAPPPPPPKTSSPFFKQDFFDTSKNTNLTKLSSSISTSSSVINPRNTFLAQITHQKKIDNQKKFRNIGFNNISLKTNSIDNFLFKFSKLLKWALKFLKRRLCNFDVLVVFFSVILFMICIISISLFQSQANSFYRKFLNKDFVEINRNTSNHTNLTENQEYLSAGSNLVKQTVLLCNGPYFSYQINNLIILPFSLILVIVFSFFNKQESSKMRKSCFKLPSLPMATNPFQRKNRFFIAAIYCILANEIFKMIESSLFDGQNLVSTNKTMDFLNTLSSFNKTRQINQSNTDFFKIGLGIEPEIVRKKTKFNKSTKKTTKAFFMAPLVLQYSKPKLRLKLNVKDFISKNNSSSYNFANIVYLSHNNDDGKLRNFNFNINVAESLTKYSKFKNKTNELVKSLNESIKASSNQTLFEFSISMYNNKYIQSLISKLFESKQFEWIIIFDKFKKISIILLEVVIIGMRYYPIMGILEKNSLTCFFLGFSYMWLDIFYNVTVTGLCEGLKLNVNFDLLKDIRRIFGIGFIYDAQEYFKTNIEGSILKNGLKSDSKKKYDHNNDQIPLDANVLFSSNRVLYTVVKSLPHFFCLSYITVKISSTLFIKLFRCIQKFKENRKKANSNNYYFDQEFVINSRNNYELIYTKIYDKLNLSKNIKEMSFEEKYVRNLFLRPTSFKPSNYFYKYLDFIFDENFRFSTRILCTYTVCFTVLYYFNCFLIFYGSIFIDLIYLPSTYKYSMFFSTLFTSIICVVQLLLNIKKLKYQIQLLYKGKKDNKISSGKVLSTYKMASSSFNYSGLAVTYTCWAYFIIFFLITFITFQVTTLIEFGSTKIVFCLLMILVPFAISVVFFRILNRFIATLAANFCFVKRNSKFYVLKNIKCFSLFLYFKFFYDCFTGIALCFVRILKSIVVCIIFLPRLDYSFMGRSMETMDSTFMFYIGYLRWESYHTNPVAISFCRLLNKNLITREKNNLTGNFSSIKVRNKWQLIYLLYKNPSLIKFRKNN